MSVPTGTKFIGIASNVDTLERKSALANSPSQVYTIGDIAESARPYKVYTALLTQSGSSNPQVSYIGTDYGSTLIVGTTYTIASNDTTDFTNVGAPNNNVGTSFVATGEVPNNQNANGNTFVAYDTGAPVVTVLENTIGNVWFTYKDIGDYRLKSNSLFEYNKTFCSISTTSDIMDPSITFTIPIVESDGIGINSDESLNKTDGLLNRTPIEIRVYN